LIRDEKEKDYDNESESNDSIISLKNVADKAPKMNIEVKFYKLDYTFKCFAAGNYT
jgi:hypothetical protein